MGVKKIRAVEVTCDACGDTQVVVDMLEVIGFSGMVAEQHENGGTGSVPFFACVAAHLQQAIEKAIERVYGEG